MIKNNISYREIKRSDYNDLEEIIKNTWGYEKFCSSKIARKMASLYLASCLANQTFTCVALNKDEVVGIIMGKNEKKHQTPLKYKTRKIFCVISMMLTKEGQKIAGMFKGIDNLNESLLSGCGKTFYGELAFFVVRSDQRGTGIGKGLFNNLKHYMKSENIDKYYLFTDSTCNYGFYEHQGFERLNKKEYCLRPHRDENMQFFLYGYDKSK